MSIKNRYNRILLSLAFLIAVMPGVVAAQATDLSVVFESNPLFANTDVKPGDTESKTITVTNNGGDTEDVYIDTENVTMPSSGSNLADVLNLIISSGGTTYYNDTFTNFFGATPVALGTLGAGDDRTYTLAVSIDSSVGNAYQLRTFSFDIVVGFAGGSSVSTGSSGGGGGIIFNLFNEQLVATTTTSGTIGWSTNRPASTFLVCGLVADGPYTLDPNDPQLGYPLAVPEVDGDTESHSATIGGLAIGTYECVPASREDPADGYTTGDRITFTIGTTGAVEGVTTIGTPVSFAPLSAPAGISPVPAPTDDGKGRLGEPGDVAGTSTDTDATSTIAGDATSTEPAAAGTCTVWWLAILALFTIVWGLLDDVFNVFGQGLRRLFVPSGVFVAVYLLLLYLAQSSGWLETWWPLFAGAWVINTSANLWRHEQLQSWAPRPHHVVFLLMALATLGSWFFFSVPCVAWPFVAIAIMSAVGWFFRL